MRKKNQWDYEASELEQEFYGGEDFPDAEDEEEGYDGYSWDNDDDGDDDAYGEALEQYGSDLSGYIEEGCSQSKKDRIEGIQDAALFLNGKERFAGSQDSDVIHERFKQYVKDANSTDVMVQQAAQEGACKDLEGFIIQIMAKFSTYTEKDRGFYDDLLQAGRLGIIQALPKYNPAKSKPTTYFFNPIRHEMVQQVNLMKHDTKPHVATTKRKIQELDQRFARYGRKPTLHDYMYSINCPFHRITNALAEMQAGNTKVSIDDPDAAPLADRQSSMRSPEESALSNVNYEKLLAFIHELEPREEIVQCYLESVCDQVKTAELAERYNLPPAEITEGIRNISNLIRNHPGVRKMYPEKYRSKENELSDKITLIPVEEREQGMQDVWDSLLAGFDGGGGDLDIDLDARNPEAMGGAVG